MRSHPPLDFDLDLSPVTFLKSDSFDPSRWDRQDYGHMPLICHQPYTYVDLNSGSSHIALDAGKAGSPQAQIFRAFAKRDAAVATALHNC